MFDTVAYLVEHEHEKLVYVNERETGLRTIIAIHNTVRGPSLGGCRLWHYDAYNDALLDVLRLSEGMSYKAAMANLPLGGGKSVIIADGKEDDPVLRKERFAAFGEVVESLDGRYITAEDVGTTTSDMVIVREHTKHVTGLPEDMGGSGDPSPVTALGVFRSMQAMIEDVLNRDNFDGLKVSIQGMGKVGSALAKHLTEAGATVIGTDVNEASIERARQLGVQIVPTEEIFDVEADIFAPCALGAVLNDDTIPRLRCKIVTGAANNQLAEPRHADMLHERGIAYGVDYVVNGGGLINVYHEIIGYNREAALSAASNIYHTVKRINEMAQREHITTYAAADRLAREALKPQAMAH